MQETVLEIQCERPQDAMGEVEKLEGIKEVALFGSGLHAIALDDQEAIPRIQAALQAARFQVERIEKIAPSLEDVFVSLIEARDRAQQPQAAVQE